MRNISTSCPNATHALRISVNFFVSLDNLRCALTFFIVVAKFVPSFKQYFFIVQTADGNPMFFVLALHLGR